MNKTVILATPRAPAARQFYYEQWNRLLGTAEEIKKFLEENKSILKQKE